MRTKRHEFDPMALIAGMVFTGIAIAYLLRADDHLSVSPGWSLAAAAIGVGVAGVAGALWSMVPRSGVDAAQVESAPTPQGPGGDFTAYAAHEDSIERRLDAEAGAGVEAGIGPEFDTMVGHPLGTEPEPETEVITVVDATPEPEPDTEVSTMVDAAPEPEPTAEPHTDPDQEPPAVDLTK
ncbi:hypothetical protein [Embleya sp. AB8]|uniref:hypothetical protein n=1 Tax=Embleya sp. AB8 TaxID=3156304 RepID=UPI003C7104DE